MEITAAEGVEAVMAHPEQSLGGGSNSSKSLLSKTSPYKYAAKKLIESIVILLSNLVW